MLSRTLIAKVNSSQFLTFETLELFANLDQFEFNLQYVIIILKSPILLVHMKSQQMSKKYRIS